MRIYTLDEIVAAARQHSPYYRQLYANVPSHRSLLITDLPVLDQNEFWRENVYPRFGALTGPLHDGIIFRSGGTSGSPKFSVFTRQEWLTFTEVFGRGFGCNGLAAGDRVANLFYAGDLYASFLFISDSLEHATVPTVHLPLSGGVAVESMAETLREFQVNVVAGVPTTILNLADHAARHNIPLAIQKIYFGGESMYPDQRRTLAGIFPGVDIRSVGYASVDAGLIGYADLSCGPNEHRALGRETIFEIIDEESGQPIQETGREGKVVITNLTRLLMPILRYPAGDRACWVDPPGSQLDCKFLLLGRSEEAARVGPMSLYYEDVQRLLHNEVGELRLSNFQLLIRHRDLKDELILILSAEADALARQAAESKIRAAVYQERHMFEDLVAGDKIWPLAIRWVGPAELTVNARTGKLRRVIDERAVASAP